MNKIAFITGVTGQDGAYLSEFLLKKGYVVHGLKRRSSLFNTDRIDHLYQDPHVEHQKFHLHYGDMTDSTNLIRLIKEIQPDEIYNLSAMSHVAVSWVYKKKREYIKHQLPNCMEKYKKCLNLKQHLFTHDHLML